MSEETTREIGGHVYTVLPLRLKAWRKFFAILSRFAGPLMAAGTAGGKDGALGALAMLLNGIDESTIVEVESLIGSSSFVVADGKKIELGDAENRDRHFSGRYASYLSWLRFGIEVNFRPLLAELGKPSQPNQTATGS